MMAAGVGPPDLGPVGLELADEVPHGRFQAGIEIDGDEGSQDLLVPIITAFATA
jgi:hypothetical protein